MSNNNRYTSCDKPSPKVNKMLEENDRVLYEHRVVNNYKTRVSNTIDCSDSHRF